MDREFRVSIGQAKQRLSDLVSLVAYRDKRVILNLKGKPIAALVSMDDLEQLREREKGQRQPSWQEWLAESERVNQFILAETNGFPLDTDQLLRAARADLEERGKRLSVGDV